MTDPLARFDQGDRERFRADLAADPTLWRVAWDGDEVAGQVRSYIDADANQEMGRRVGWAESLGFVVRQTYIILERPQP